ncbi:oligosaccharide flippase family protein [Arthrobacter sp. PvP103]|uniref:oligosaccharide flippase family protein n=1 Tax=Arthrobacter sp. PvP103 TaxID=2806593 RepID=UPI001AE496FC|nr:oligosaccharide flippase family protein [Arthrobacter sp. PvP103]
MTKHVISVAASNLALPMAAFAAGPILAHSLGVEGRGQLTAAVAPLMLFTAIGTIGLPEAVNYFVARNPRLSQSVVRSASWLLALSGALATVIAIGAAPLLAGGSATVQSLIVMAVLATMPTLIIGAVRGAAQGLHLWNRVNAERYVTASTRLLALISLWASGHLTPFTGTLALVISPLLGGLAYVRLPLQKLGHREKMPVGTLMGYGTRIWLGSLSGILLARIDQVLMTPLGGAYALGLYAVAVNIAEVVLITNHAVRDVMFSADAADSNDERIYMSSRLSMLTSALIGLIICLSMPMWVPVVFGGEFDGSILPAAVLIAAYIIWVPGSMAGATLSARGRPGQRSIGLFIATVANVMCLILLVPGGGALGAAYAMLIGNVVASAYTLWCVRRYFGMHIWSFYSVRPSDIRLILGKLTAFTRGKERGSG